MTLPSSFDPAEIDALLERHGRARSAVLPLLQAVQKRYRYLPLPVLEYIATHSDIPASALTGVATFYPQFRLSPAGEHTVHVCVGTACHVKGSERVVEALARHLDLKPGCDTDAAGRFTVQKVACLGCCTLAPVVQIDRVTYGHVLPGQVHEILEDFLEHKAREEAEPSAGQEFPNEACGEIRIGLGSCCVAGGSDGVRRAAMAYARQRRVPLRVKRVGCVGMCHRTPLLEVIDRNGQSTFYARVQPHDVPAILDRHFPPARRLARWQQNMARRLAVWVTDAFHDPSECHGLRAGDPGVAAFRDPQLRWATEGCGEMDPTDLEEYRRHHGFEGWERCRAMADPWEVIHEIDRSGLRGRGGAGFPTGRKWALVRQAAGERKFVVCNGDEGDPGAFMDRMILESYPYRVLEGLMIAAYATGAREGVLYIRAEYPLAVQRVREALDRMEAAGYIGRNPGAHGMPLRLEVVEGAGAFVCGEETALLAAVEGRRGTPRYRPPYPAESGLWGCPTLINNVETLALVPRILRCGAEAFAQVGTERSRGTKVFALAGKVRRGGLIEVPMGITIRRIVEEIGGGVGPGRTFKAVQVGGPSGGCIPASLADLPVDYEALTAAGAMMGSGGFVVLDDRDCMVDMARYFLSFTQRESCGKCTFCRIGTKRMLEILDRLCLGQGRRGDLETLEQLARAVQAGSLCGLGKTAPNPVLTTLRYFRDEYEAHLEGRCPARQCKALVQYRITERCMGCTRCAQVCPVEAIAFRPYARHEIDSARCTRCDTCRQVCPVEAVEIVTGPDLRGAPSAAAETGCGVLEARA